MNCPKCGGINADSARFCVYCGSELAGGAQSQNPAPQQNPYSAQPQQNPYSAQPQQNPYSAQSQPTYAYTPQPSKNTVVKENIPLGIIGALIGGLIGGLSIVLFFRMDMIASISGLILAFCTLKGYSLLGKKLSWFGIIISVVIMLAMPFLAYLVDGALDIMKPLGCSFGDAFRYCVRLIESGRLSVGDIISDIGMLYLFVVIGGVGTVVTAVKNK